MGRKRPRAKTKTVLKPVKQWDQLGNMQNWISKTFLNKNHPSVHGGRQPPAKKESQALYRAQPQRAHEEAQADSREDHSPVRPSSQQGKRHSILRPLLWSVERPHRVLHSQGCLLQKLLHRICCAHRFDHGNDYDDVKYTTKKLKKCSFRKN